MKRCLTTMAAVSALALGVSVQGATIPTYLGGAEESFALTYPNLLTGATIPTPAPSGLGSNAGLIDGKYGNWDHSCFFNSSPTWPGTALLVLATPSDIGQIRTISSFGGGLVAQDYTVSYTTDASPTLSSTFTVIGSALAASHPGGAAEQVDFGNTSASIVGGANVTALKFVVDNQVVMAEFEAFAPVTIPEPASLGLGLLGMGIIALGRRRMA